MKLILENEKDFGNIPHLRLKKDEDKCLIATCTRRHRGDKLFFVEPGKLGIYYSRETQKAATWRRKELIKILAETYGISEFKKQRDWKLADFIFCNGKFPEKGDVGFTQGSTEEDRNNPIFKNLIGNKCNIGDFDGIIVFEPKKLGDIPKIFFRGKKTGHPGFVKKHTRSVESYGH